MMRKQNKGSDFLPMQSRKNSELSIILTSLIFHCELAMINFLKVHVSGWFCGGNSAETRWMKNPLRRELEWGIRKIRGGLKNQPQRFGGRGGDFEKPPELYCTYPMVFCIICNHFYHMVAVWGMFFFLLFFFCYCFFL